LSTAYLLDLIGDANAKFEEGESVRTTTHVAVQRTIFNNLRAVPEGEEKASVPREPTGPCKCFENKERELAERVGFEPSPPL
jgi:hypothetical protein